MTVLQVSDLKFGFAGDTLFEKVTFNLSIGDRIALVAPNGAGKSTLLRLLAKEFEPDTGFVNFRGEAAIGYYRQSHEVKPEGDVLSALLSGFTEITELRKELASAQELAASGSSHALGRLSELSDRYHIARGDELEHRVAGVATKLGFTDLGKSVKSMSGGERGRLQLGVILAKQPEILILDEPTNHLDLDTIAWLEAYLAGYRGALLIVSHDRQFLDNTTTQTFELGTRGLRIYPAKYTDYVALREVELERERALQGRQQAMIEKTEDFIRKNMAGQKSKQAQSRRKMLDKVDRLENPEDVWDVAERVAFRFAPALRTGDIVLECKGLRAERGARTLFSDLNLLVKRGERIGIVGPNGSGKSTLLKLIAGMGQPSDTGLVKRGTNLQEGYFDQHLGNVDPKCTAVEEVRKIRGDFTVEAARQYLARFRFWGDDPLRVVSGFSGGECSRLALAKLLLEPRNLIFLDEPTNHLDIPAAEILEEALVGFDGTVFFVSHDRRFLEGIATRILSVRDGNVEVFSGGYRDFAAAQKPIQKPVAQEKEQKPVRPQVALHANAQTDQKQKAREREKQKRRLVDLEAFIAAGEAQVLVLREALKEDPAGDWAKLTKLVSEEQALTQKIERLMQEWETLSNAL
jgi:ATP-binding cassette, subfamily F, member 3